MSDIISKDIKDLRTKTIEVVKYILPESEHDDDVIQNYVDTILSICEEYHHHKQNELK